MYFTTQVPHKTCTFAPQYFKKMSGNCWDREKKATQLDKQVAVLDMFSREGMFTFERD